MERYQIIKDKLLKLAKKSSDVKAIIAIGSSVRDFEKADEFSDLDLIIATHNPNEWLYGDNPSKLGNVKISFVEPTLGGGLERRILYEGALDVDFIIFTPAQLKRAIEDGTAQCVMNRGYLVLHDEMEVSRLLEQHIKVQVMGTVLSESEFTNLTHNFWFHTVWAAKKIIRGELWTAKMCIDAYLKRILLKILECKVLSSEKSDVWHEGRFLEKWADEDTVNALGNCFAHYEKNDMVFALFNTALLFGKNARKTAIINGYNYPHMAERYAFELLVEYFGEKMPKPYEESDSAFWDDEHISKYMLESHLNPDSNNASRRQTDIVVSVNWIESICGKCEGKKLLDLGCGPGIYARLLAEMGFKVTGIDFSKRSIDYAIKCAKENNQDIVYHYQDYLKMDYSEEFDVVILIYCDFGVLPPDSRKILLEKIHKALKSGGILILDAFGKEYLNSFKELQSISSEKEGFWSKEPYVVIQQNVFYEETANTLEQYQIITSSDSKKYNIWNQIYTKDSLANEAGQAGFCELMFVDDVKGREFTGCGETICGVFQKVEGMK